MLEFWKGSGPPTWASGRALAVQVGILGGLWASKLGSMGGFGQPNEAPKESFGPPKSVAKRLRMHFCNVMRNLEKPMEMVFAWFFRCYEAFRRNLDLQVELLDWL